MLNWNFSILDRFLDFLMFLSVTNFLMILKSPMMVFGPLGLWRMWVRLVELPTSLSGIWYWQLRSSRFMALENFPRLFGWNWTMNEED